MVGAIVGNYKIIDKIGEGGMGSVFKGVDLMLEREVAIKMLRPELARQPNVVERFRTEAVTLAKLNHSNVATLHSFFRQGEDFFMVMEFVRGKTLDALIREQGAMQCGQAIELFCMALEGIDHAHKMGIVHRDIKPANMMLTETGSIKVMDFGIARVMGTDRLTQTGHLIGTVEYMSPEQVRGEETDARSDIYSLGILLYEMLTGRVPFNSKSEYELMRSQIEDAPAPPRTHAPHIPLSVEQAIMRSLAKNRDARYQSAGEFRAMLLEKNTGFVTRADTPAASYVTRVSEPFSGASPSGQVIKETRLGSDAAFMPGALASPLKETRMARDAGIIAPRYEQTTPPYPTVQAHPGGSPASLLGKLNWMHYAGAAVVLVALIGVPLALIGGGAKSTQPPAVVQPPPSTPAASETTPAQNVVPQPNQSTVPTPSLVPRLPDDPGVGSGSAKSRRSRSAASSKSALPGTSSPARNATQSQSNKTAQEKSTSVANKETPVAEKSKAAKVGAATVEVFKGIGGVFKKKKKPANQQP